MNRNLILILVLLVAAGTAIYFWNNKKDPNISFERAESNFKIEDVNTIDRIIITHRDGIRSDLKRKGDNWTINDEYKARQTNIDHLLRGINRQHLDHIPNDAALESILSTMAVTGIHVEIFDKSGKELLNYYVGGVTQDERGTYFLKEGSTQPYCLFEPGFEGSLRARYLLKPVDWRDVRFWIEEIENIDTFKVNYPKQRLLSFLIFKKGTGYGIDPLFSTTPRKEKDNPHLINSYLTVLSQLACEDFINDAPEKDSILQMVPFVEIDMIYRDKKSYLRFFPAGQPVHSEFSPAVARYFIDYSGKDFMVGQHEVMKGAFRSYDYFFQ